VFDSGSFTRRQHIKGLAGLLYVAAADNARAANQSVAYGQNTIPAGIHSRFVDNINGLRMHMLEAGCEGVNRPCVLLLHGLPELAYVWAKVMLPLASAGYHVIAPDLRGYGRTTGWDPKYDCDLRAFGVLNMVMVIAATVWLFGVPLHGSFLLLMGLSLLCLSLPLVLGGYGRNMFINLGFALVKAGRLEEGIAHCRKAAR
jgi:pimeloyl-ACP methyl ester carboxylesterase